LDLATCPKRRVVPALECSKSWAKHPFEDIQTDFARNCEGGARESGGFTFDGSTPGSGAHTSDGELHCGTCAPSRWFGDDVKPFHEQIRGHREKQGPKSTKSKTANRKLQQLKTQSAELKRNLSALKSGGQSGDDDTAATEESHDNAGDSLGGQQSMKKKSKDEK
jgi:hypothetical protein